MRDPPAPGRFQFDAIVMENGAPPPGAASLTVEAVRGEGHRLWPHTRCLGREPGKHASCVAPRGVAQVALRGDLALLTARKLVDYPSRQRLRAARPLRLRAQMQHASDSRTEHG